MNKYLAIIIANDQEGLQMISACSSAAKVKISDIKYLASNKVFLLSIERIKVENENEDKKVNSILRFDFVDKVRSKNIDQSNLEAILELVGMDKGVSRIAAANLMMTKRGPMFLADTTININPNAEHLAKISHLTASLVKKFGMNPVMAMLSFSNFGVSETVNAQKTKEAVNYIHENYPNVVIDGEVQADFALNPELLEKEFPFSKLNGKKVNTLIFPNLESANITYKLMKELNEALSIGPILMGLSEPIHILQLGASVAEIVNMSAVAVVDAQTKNK